DQDRRSEDRNPHRQGENRRGGGQSDERPVQARCHGRGSCQASHQGPEDYIRGKRRGGFERCRRRRFYDPVGVDGAGVVDGPPLPAAHAHGR
ncbi:unnamed protein product, partial [Ectocarpus fasciculatus]